MSEIVRVPFHGDDVLTVDVDGKPHIILKPVIEAIGLDYWPQIEKLRKRSWAALASRQVQVSDQGQRREMLTVDVRTFLMLLATVDENRVGADVKPKLIAYQAEVADAIEAYWTQGGAINPRATEEQLENIARRAKVQAEVLGALRDIVDPAWLDAKGRHLAARALGEEPDIDPATRPLTVGEYLTDKGVTGRVGRSLAPTFGKNVKRAFRARYDTEPPIVERFIDGALRPVAAYTEAHRGLFDQVWDQLAEATS